MGHSTSSGRNSGNQAGQQTSSSEYYYSNPEIARQMEPFRNENIRRARDLAKQQAIEALRGLTGRKQHEEASFTGKNMHDIFVEVERLHSGGRTFYSFNIWDQTEGRKLYSQAYESIAEVRNRARIVAGFPI